MGDPAQLEGLRVTVERRLRELLAVRAEVTFVAPDTLPRFEGKAKRLVKLYAGETAQAFRTRCDWQRSLTIIATTSAFPLCPVLSSAWPRCSAPTPHGPSPRRGDRWANRVVTSPACCGTLSA